MKGSVRHVNVAHMLDENDGKVGPWLLSANETADREEKSNGSDTVLRDESFSFTTVILDIVEVSLLVELAECQGADNRVEENTVLGVWMGEADIGMTCDVRNDARVVLS